ncbi:MAG: CYTH and CHAD domain-containing protein [Acidobacteria bacterium]|nr:CYTH and CHAD domain-containing protein [Acidobacteriota bacterium]
MAPDASIEREVKLAVWPGFRLPDLSGVVDQATASPAADQQLEATYYDTEDLRLGRSGITLRYRTGESTDAGDAGVWTLKLPDESATAGALSRAELTVAGDPRAVPAELNEVVAARVRTATLGPVARLQTARRRTDVRDASGELVAEVVDDEVSVLDGDRVALRFREVEVELGAAGDESALAELVVRLRAAGAGAPDPTPKVIRALGPAAVLPPELAEVTLGKRPTAAQVLRAGLTRSVRRLIDHDVLVREGADPEGVHQARVATRRLRSDLRVYESLLQPGWVDPLRDELSWLADRLGGVRDADVLLSRLERQLSELGPADRVAGSRLVAILGAERAERRGELLEAYRSSRYLELLDRLVAAAAAPPTLAAADRAAGDVLPALARGPWLSFAKAARRITTQSPGDALHKVRIRAKRARYAAEVASIAVGRPAQRLADALAAAQDVLGDHHDAGVAGDWLRAAAADAAPDVAFVAGELLVRQRVEADRHLEAWPAVWDRLQKGRLTSWLKA